LIEVALLLSLHGGAPAFAGDALPAAAATATATATPSPSPKEVAEILRLRALLQRLDLLREMGEAEALPVLESQTDEVDDDR